jgi:hypothetical protein
MNYNGGVGSWTGRSLPASSDAGRGKSELRRAVCRITSGRVGSSPFDGKCHRKHTAPVFKDLSFGIGVRVKRCGKSAPPRQQCSGQGKPHTEQDQIGREPELDSYESGCRHVPARCVQPSGRSLEPRSNARPRGMTVPPEQSGGQNSAYRSGCHKLLLSITCRTPVSVVTPV